MPRTPLHLAPALEETISLKEGFALEATEALDAIEASLLVLEQQPESREEFSETLRHLHTLRSNAATLSLDQFHNLIQWVESIVDWLQHHPSPPEKGLLSLLFEAIDRIRLHSLFLLEAEQAKRATQAPLAPDTPISGSTTQGQPSAPESKAPSQNGHEHTIPVQFNLDSEGDDAMACKLEVAFRALKNGTPVEEPMLGELLIQEGKLKRNAMERVLELQNQPMGELLVALGLASPEHVAEALSRQGGHGPAKPTIRIENRRLAHFAETATELLRACTLLPDGGDPNARNEAVLQIRRQARLLWGEASQLLQTSLRPLFQRLTRIARDLGVKTGKEIDVAFSGENVELEVGYVDALTRVLPHAIRNAIDHGIESPDERTRCGKAAAGQIRMLAIRNPSDVTLVVADDGRGLDEETLATRAVALDIADTTQQPAPEKWAMLFEPGFTSRPTVDDLAGRGIGLNALREALVRLGGTVWIESEIHVGMRLFIKFPTQAGHVDGVVLTASGTYYVIPEERVIEYARPTFEQCRKIRGQTPQLPLRGERIPLSWLASCTGRCPPKQPLWESLVVVVTIHDQPIGLVVDDLLGPQRVPATPVSRNPMPGLPGTVILEDGNLAEMLSLDGLFSGSKPVNSP